MREIHADLQARLDTGTTRLCRCWRVTRKDGVALGFTDHDRNLNFEDTVFQASTGMDASALERSTGLSVDNGQAIGALSAVGLRGEDILAGRYDAAEVVHWLVDWERPDLRVVMFRGSLGEIRQAAGAFEVELRGLGEELNKPIGRAFLKTCDRALGDRKCGFDLTTPGYFAEVEVIATIERQRISVSLGTGFDANWFARGKAVWLTGANAGLEGLIKSDRIIDTARVLDLWEESPYAVQPGDQLRLLVGCDKRAETCILKFNNFKSFRGFPHISGEDWVMAYPKQGDQHDGKSRNG